MKRPNTRSFLAGLVEDHIDKRFSSFGIDLSKYLGRNFNEITIELAFVPFCEGAGKFRSVHSRDVLEDCIGFTNQLYVAVLDAVVDHFNVMACAVRPHVSTARFPIHLRRDFAEDWRNNFPGFSRTARHQRWSLQRAFFAAGNTTAHKMNAALFQFFAAPLRVGEKGISAVDDDIALLQQRGELIDDSVHRRPRFHHDHGFARAFQRANEFLDRTRRLNIFVSAAPSRKFVCHFRRAVEDRDGESFRFHVQDEVFAHHSETDEANITLIRCHFSIFLFDVSKQRRPTTVAST